MTYFTYQLTHRRSGEDIKGTIESDTLDVARYHLQMTSHYFLSLLKPISIFSRIMMRFKSSTSWLFFGLSKKDVLYFSRELKTFLEAGFSLLSSLRLLEKVVQKRSLRLLMTDLSRSLESGRSFSEAISEHASLFSDGYVVSIQSAEVSGQMIDVLTDNIRTLDWELSVVRSFYKAMIIPVFVFSLLFLMTYFLIFFLVPRIIPYLERSDKEIPVITQGMIDIKAFLLNSSGEIGFFFVAVGIFFLGMYFTRFGRYSLDVLLLKTPVLGQVYRSFMCMKFSALFHLLFKSGLRITTCLELCSGLFRRGVFEKEVRQVNKKLLLGQSLSSGFQESSFFPIVFVQLVVSGDLTSSLTSKLDQISRVFSSQINDYTMALISSIEFIYIGVLLAYIFIILFGLYIPMISVMVP